MAHFAKIGINSKVIEVIPLSDEYCRGADSTLSEEIGRQYLENTHGWPLWKQTYKKGTSRGNFARIGGTYDDDKELFWDPKPHPSWTKDETSYKWVPPVDMPNDDSGYNIYWDEDNDRWLGKDRADETIVNIWNPDTSTWSSL